jgi:hypothetical protein
MLSRPLDIAAASLVALALAACSQTRDGADAGAVGTASATAGSARGDGSAKVEMTSIGTATMDPDGTIVLMLRATAPGITGDARITYPPSHAEYQNVLKHLGGLKPGESKSVPPWPDAP